MRNFEIALVEGSVGVIPANSNFQYKIKPNELLEISSGSNEVQVKAVDTELYTSWVKGYYLFKDEPLYKIAEKLASYYQVNIELQNDNLKEVIFSGKINLDESLEDVLRSMNHIITINFVKQDGNYFIN